MKFNKNINKKSYIKKLTIFFNIYKRKRNSTRNTSMLSNDSRKTKK